MCVCVCVKCVMNASTDNDSIYGCVTHSHDTHKGQR